MLSFNRQAFLVDGKHKFWGGMVFNMIGTSRSYLELFDCLKCQRGISVTR